MFCAKSTGESAPSRQEKQLTFLFRPRTPQHQASSANAYPPCHWSTAPQPDCLLKNSEATFARPLVGTAGRLFSATQPIS